MPADMQMRHARGNSVKAPGTIRHGFGQPTNKFFSKEKCIRAGSAALFSGPSHSLSHRLFL